jgi:hypothetical protein
VDIGGQSTAKVDAVRIVAGLASFLRSAVEAEAPLSEEPPRPATTRTNMKLRVTLLFAIVVFLRLRIIKHKTARA